VRSIQDNLRIKVGIIKGFACVWQEKYPGKKRVADIVHDKKTGS
jgi:hypothetical protein